MADEKNIDEALQVAREAKAKRDAAKDQESKRRELAILQLEERFETELGTRGEAFEIVDGGVEGGIVLSLGASVLYKRFTVEIGDGKGSTGKGLTLESALTFVAPCVAFPDKATALAIFERRANLVFDCATALMGLYGRNEGADRSKR